MDPAWIGVIGGGIAVVGTLLGTLLTQYRADERERLRIMAEFQREEHGRRDETERLREERLFEHKRSAYSEFIAKYHSMYNALFPYVIGIRKDWPGIDYDTFDPLYEKWTDVAMYGSPEAAAKGEELIRAIHGWADCLESVLQRMEDELDQAREAFMAAVRVDLGVERHDVGEGQEPALPNG